jgi:alkylation response protein AidB-like acyl-CoA dehydrogenase
VILVPTPDQEALAASAAAYLAGWFQPGHLREAVADVPADRWREAGELGLFGLALPAEVGGVDLLAAEEVLVMRALGQRLASPNFIATLLAAHAANQAGSDLTADLLAGNVVVACTAEAYPGSVEIVEDRVNGPVDVFNGSLTRPDYLLVMSGSRFALVPSPELTTPVKSIDNGAFVSQVVLESAPAAFAGDDRSLYLRGVLYVSAMLTGIAEATRDMSVDYVLSRSQYGKPIGSFQAIKHRCADMAAAAEVALATTCYAAVLFDEHDATAELTALAAKDRAAYGALLNCRENIQNHGGIGFTYEHDAHLYLRRVHTLTELFGSRTENLSLLIEAPSPFGLGE